MRPSSANLERAVRGLCGVAGVGAIVLGLIATSGHGAVLVVKAHAAQEDTTISPNFVCSESTVAGTYGFQRHGTKIDGTLITSVGNITFDGQGNVAGGQEWTMRNGVMTYKAIGGGTYVISPDCTGQIVDPALGPISRFAVVSRGRELLGMSLSAGNSVWARYEKVMDTPGAPAIVPPDRSR